MRFSYRDTHWSLTSDDNAWCLANWHPDEDGEPKLTQKGNPRLTNRTYLPRFEQVLEKLAEIQLRKHDAESLADLVDEHKKIRRELRELLKGVEDA